MTLVAEPVTVEPYNPVTQQSTLCGRVLVEPEFVDNYPRVAATSFFKVNPGGTLVRLPSPSAVSLAGAESSNGGGPVEVDIPELDGVICNPPYVRACTS